MTVKWRIIKVPAAWNRVTPFQLTIKKFISGQYLNFQIVIVIYVLVIIFPKLSFLLLLMH